MPGERPGGDARFDESDSDSEFEGFTEADIGASADRFRNRQLSADFVRDSDDDFDVSDISSLDSGSDADVDDNDDAIRAKPWTTTLENPPDIPFATAALGVVNSVFYSSLSAVELFFFTEYILREIVTETNTYAGQCMNKEPRIEGQRIADWNPLTIPELKTWLGLLLAMGLVQKKGRVAEYWSTHWLTKTPGFNITMSSRRFLHILRFLHFVDNEDATVDKGNKLWKIGNVLAYLNKRFSGTYNPRRELSIDETMLKFKGRLSIKQYIKIKPVKWGIKLFTIAEAKTGYVLNILPYLGKRADTAFGKTTQVVLDVGKGYLLKGHYFFTDNYYTSVELMMALEKRNTLLCGTVNSNRVGLPSDIKKTCPTVKKLKRGDSLKRMKGRMLCVTWMDTRVVNLLCNLPNCLGDSDVKRRDKKQRGIEITVSRPRAIELYNTSMGGVDLSDQLVSSYRRHMKSYTWYLQVFFHLVQLSAVQSYILHNELHPDAKLTQKKFIESLIEGLIGGRTYTQKRGRPSAAPLPVDMRFDRTLDHAPIKYATQSKCAVHTKRVDTLFRCGVCNVRMCPVPCFYRYHYVTQYAYDDPCKAHAAPARKRKR